MLICIRSIADAIQDVDGFKYLERRAQNKEGSDGARFSFICQNSIQNLSRRRKPKKQKPQDSAESEDHTKKGAQVAVPSFDCNGAIYLKFSLKRAAINVVYKHNPIHSRPIESNRYVPSTRTIIWATAIRCTVAVELGFPYGKPDIPWQNLQVTYSLSFADHFSDLPALVTEDDGILTARAGDLSKKATKRKRRSKNKDETEANDDFASTDFGIPTVTEISKQSKKVNNKKNGAERSSETTRSPVAKRDKKSKEPLSPLISKKRVVVTDSSLPAEMTKSAPCVRCCEKKIKCNEAKPTCNQCRRGLWICIYEVPGKRKRSKLGCLNCKQRRRKCTEEKPSCAHCLRMDDTCEYADDY